MFSTWYSLKVLIAILCTSYRYIVGVSAMTCIDVKLLCKEQVGCSLAWHNYHIHCWNVINGDKETCSLTCKRSISVLLSTQSGIGRLFTSCNSSFPDERENQRRLNFCSRFISGLSVMSPEDDTSAISCSSARILCETDARCHTAFQVFMSQCRPEERGLNCTRDCAYSLHHMFILSRAANLRKCTCDTDPEYQDCKIIHGHFDECDYQNGTYAVIKNRTSAGDVNRFHLFYVLFFVTLNVFVLKYM
jgi:hypothetical protein